MAVRPLQRLWHGTDVRYGALWSRPSTPKLRCCSVAVATVVIAARVVNQFVWSVPGAYKGAECMRLQCSPSPILENQLVEEWGQ